MSAPKTSSISLLSLLSRPVIITVLFVILAIFWSVEMISGVAGFVTFVAMAILIMNIETLDKTAGLPSEDGDSPQSIITTRRSGGIKSVRANTLHAVPLPILIIGEDHRISFANNAAKELIGDEIAGNDVHKYLRQSKIVEAIQKIFIDGEKYAGVIRYENNQKRSFDVTISRVSGTGSKKVPTQAMAFFYEVTSLLQTEQMRVDFVANASHELRTPLSSVIGFIETLQGPAKNDRPARERFLGIMQTETERMVRLIDDLLSLSRIEMSRHEAPDSEVNLITMINSVVLTASAVGKDRGMLFKVNIEKEAGRVIADPDQLMQVLINLTVNAAKYADRDTTIFVDATTDAATGKIKISIRDEGPGITEEHLARLTERFYRVDNARSRKMGGTGLGLAIVKHILLRHDSVLNVESQVGMGTSFSFELSAPASD